MDCSRSITFTILGTIAAPGVQVTVVEDEGALVFTLQVLGAGGLIGDLRGLFFDLNDDDKLIGLAHSGTSLITDFDTGNVIDLGNGANMNGVAPFDVGIEFGTQGIGKDDIQTATFTLSNAADNLTLDDIAHTAFGVRMTGVGPTSGTRSGDAKLTTIAPAAPDAMNDSPGIFEDGQSGLGDPSLVPEGVLFQVLANDTDADGDTLTITAVSEASNGTVEIVDGDDADTDIGDAILYTPDADYAGPDSFTYCITDNNGGTDFAQVAVAIEAVADVPDLDVQVLAGDAVNQIRFTVTAAPTDGDGSEYLHRIEISIYVDGELIDGLPDGVTLDLVSSEPGDDTNEIVQEYLLTLPLDETSDFDLEFAAVSKETSNGDEQTGSQTIAIDYEYNSSTTLVEFLATDQSIWSTGGEFELVDDRFVGVNTGAFDEEIGSEFYAGASGHIKLGFQSTLIFEGGEIDATADYDVTVETNYNKTTDQLLIETGSLLTAASFATQGPEGSYTLDFIYDVFLSAFAGVDVSFGTIPTPVGDFDLGGLQKEVSVGPLDLGPGSFNLIDLTSDELGGTIPFPLPLNSLSVNFDWPEIQTAGEALASPVVASGSSENFFEIELDIDTLATQLLGLPNIFNPQLTAGPFFADIDLLDVDVIGGLNLLQDFEMSLGDLAGVLTFEDGSVQTFTIGDSLLIDNASLIDQGSLDPTHVNGLVEFNFAVVPVAFLQNVTNLGFNIGGEITLLSVDLGYDVTIPVPLLPDVHITDSFTLGPLEDFGESVPLGDINVFDETFLLAFETPTDLYFYA